MRTKVTPFVGLILFTCLAALAAQEQPDGDALWRAFLAWFRTAPAAVNPIAGYTAILQRDQVPPDEIQRRSARLATLLDERTDWIGVYFDKVFARPLTGHPARDGFDANPSALLKDAAAQVRPGTALDGGMGQGRNAVYLARQGWQVTGFDISSEAIKAARLNASAAAVSIDAVEASYDSFDFGVERWDLIVLAFAWAPVNDANFMARLRTSLRPGGLVVFEHFVEQPDSPRPRAIRALKPGELRLAFRDFRIDRYEEVDAVGEWGGPGVRLVRMVAAKPASGSDGGCVALPVGSLNETTFTGVWAAAG